MNDCTLRPAWAWMLSLLTVLGCAGGGHGHLVGMDLQPNERVLPLASNLLMPWSATGGDFTLGGEPSAMVSEPMPPAPVPWAPLGWVREQPGGYDSDVYRWLDSHQRQRTAVLTRNDARDPGGSHGGMLRQYRIFVGDQERVATGTGVNNMLNGWGYVLSHYDKQVTRSADTVGRHRQVFVGRHHAIHEFSWDLPIGDSFVKVTVHWFFATGRDHPVYAITFDSHVTVPKGLTVLVDSRAPYGEIAWDGDGTNALVDGVQWGDKYRFFTRDEPLTAQSRWDYSQPNTVPHALTYSRSADAEMGSVQTLSWSQQSTGGTWFYDNWGRTSETRNDTGGFGTWKMPANWNWPYQLCQYEMDDFHPTRSKRLAWGLMYGAVGKSSYWGYGYEKLLSSHPYQSYSVFMVMGRQSSADVLAQVTQVERLLQAQLSATVGQVVTQGPGGVARQDTVAYPVAGYNDTYGVHELQADRTGGFTLTLNAAGGALRNPIFLIRKMGGVPARLSLDGTELVADQGYFASYDAYSDTVWLTLNRVWSGSHTLAGSRP
jgi:phage-related protein